ncbi:hypothetical protein GCM10025871_15480 [Deinococcus metallilatus]|nr:hypothetical protein GCM10025871_15480 [Deinococcus metallilatus]
MDRVAAFFTHLEEHMTRYGDDRDDRWTDDGWMRDNDRWEMDRGPMSQDSYGDSFDRDYDRSGAGVYGADSGSGMGYEYGSSGRIYGPDYRERHMSGQSGMESHRGKGPRGYQRSDDRIREQVNDALEDEHGVDASDIEVQVQNGEVTLTGTVNDRNQKRMAEDCVERVRGVKDVHNRLRVQQGGTGMSTGDRAGSTTVITAGTGNTTSNQEP